MSLSQSEHHSSIDYVLLAVRAQKGLPVASDTISVSYCVVVCGLFGSTVVFTHYVIKDGNSENIY
jgi:hypothetical protein